RKMAASRKGRNGGRISALRAESDCVCRGRAASRGDPGTARYRLRVPDLMGTQLEDGNGSTIWPSLSGLAKGGLNRLADVNDGVKAGGLIPELYAPMANRLQQHYQ